MWFLIQGSIILLFVAWLHDKTPPTSWCRVSSAAWSPMRSPGFGFTGRGDTDNDAPRGCGALGGTFVLGRLHKQYWLYRHLSLTAWHRLSISTARDRVPSDPVF
jgi:hypothetical protein